MTPPVGEDGIYLHGDVVHFSAGYWLCGLPSCGLGSCCPICGFGPDLWRGPLPALRCLDGLAVDYVAGPDLWLQPGLWHGPYPVMWLHPS